MTSETTALIRNGFVFIPASSFNRDDQGNESLSPHELGAAAISAPSMPALTPEQQQILRMAYDANTVPESRGGVDGLWIDFNTAVQWGLIPAPVLAGDIPLPQAAPNVPQPTPRPSAAQAQPTVQASATSANKRKVSPVRPRLSRPWDRRAVPKLVPPGFE
jgi:hypothetical protein